MRKKILIAIVGILIVIQFLQPGRNKAEGISEADITNVYPIPKNVHQIFENKCYDCHSHNTRYPWYYSIQPIGWWMDYHIREGKDELNFSDFKSYDIKKANHKLEEITEAVNEGWMPLKSYQWIHKESKVTPDEAAAITSWIKSMGIEAEPQ